MAKGWDNIEQQAAQTAEARQEMQEKRLPELRVNQRNPGPYVIRFLEQGTDVNNYPVHEYKVVQGGNTYNRNFTCLSEVGQPCPGCEAGLKRKNRGVFNLIQRNRPILRKGQDGKSLKNPDGSYIVDGYQDTVVVANVGGPTADMLRKSDGDYRGLMSRDFQVQFSGDTFQSYFLTPAMDGQGNAVATPLSESDQYLAANKHNLDAYMRPPTYEKAQEIIRKYGQNSGAQIQQPGGYPQGAPPQGNAGQAQPANGFLAGVTQPLAGPPASAFGAAQAAVAPQPVPVSQPQVPAPIQQQPAMPPATSPPPVPQQPEPGTGQPVVPVIPGPGAPPVQQAVPQPQPVQQ